MFTHIRKQKLALMALLFAALPSASYAYEKCSDMPGYRLAVDDRDDKLRQIGEVKSKIWVLDIPKKGVNYEKTLNSLIKSAHYGRTDYYAECIGTLKSEFFYNYLCTNRYGKSIETDGDKIPDRNGLPMKLYLGNLGELRRFYLCKTYQQLTLSVGPLYYDWADSGKLWFRIQTDTYSPFKIKKEAPSPSDYRF